MMRVLGKAFRGFLVAALIVIIAGIEPAIHHHLQRGPVEGYAPTGLHTASSGMYLLCMRSLVSGFRFPFVAEEDAPGTSAMRYYLGPVAMLYGILGEVGRLIRVNDFLLLGWANGVAGGLFLWMAWRFFRVALPEGAMAAFMIFTSGAGLGAVLYLGLDRAGMLGDAGARAVLAPFAVYGLRTGPGTSPALMMPHLTLTLPLALGLAGLASMLRSDTEGFRRHTSGSVRKVPFGFLGLTLAAAALISPGTGGLAWCVGAVYFAFASQRKFLIRTTLIVGSALPVAVGMALRWLVLRQHPAGGLRAFPAAGEDFSLLAAGLALLPLLPAVLVEAWRASRQLGPLGRGIGASGAGFLFFYTSLHTEQWLVARYEGGREAGDYDVLRTACFGFTAGLLPLVDACFRRRGEVKPVERSAWLGPGFWLLLPSPLLLLYFLPSGTIPAWLDIYPEAILPFLGILAAALTARALLRVRPWAMTVVCSLIVVLGLANGAIVYGYYVEEPGAKLPTHARHAVMVDAEHTLLDAVPAGRILPGGGGTRIPAVLALRPNIEVAGARAAQRIGGEAFDAQRADKLRFFAPETSALERREILNAREVEYVYCAATEPVDAATMAALRDTTWLKELAAAGEGAVFLVAIE